MDGFFFWSWFGALIFEGVCYLQLPPAGIDAFMKYLKIEEVTECLLNLSVYLYFSMFYVNCDGRRRKKHVLQHMEKSCMHLTPERSIGLSVFGSSVEPATFAWLEQQKTLISRITVHLCYSLPKLKITLAAPLYWLLISKLFQKYKQDLSIKGKIEQVLEKIF